MNTSIPELEDTIENIIRKIKALKYKFPPKLEEDAKEELDNAIESLETWLEMAVDDNEETNE